jgi:ribonuclease HII
MNGSESSNFVRILYLLYPLLACRRRGRSATGWLSGVGMPDFAIEDGCRGVVCGVDEAGRGPLAGPVVAAAVILDRASFTQGLAATLDDSKLLRREVREACYSALLGCARIGVGAASVREIDRINILRASLLAMSRAVAALGVRPDIALVDGNMAPPALPCAARTVVGGDALSFSIAAASVVAKVTRDRIMRALALRHPNYAWENNVGYSTRAHFAAIAAFGVTLHHRRSFEPVRLAAEGPAEPDLFP